MNISNLKNTLGKFNQTIEITNQNFFTTFKISIR